MTTPTSIAASIGSPCSIATASVAAQSPTFDPTETSISPVTMTRVMPRATIAAGTAPAIAIEMFDDGQEVLGGPAAADERADQEDEEEQLPAREQAAQARHRSAPGRHRAGPPGSRAAQRARAARSAPCASRL